jgi:hypothetical protein
VPNASLIRGVRARVRRLLQRLVGVDAVVDQMVSAQREIGRWRQARQLMATAAWGEMSLTESNDSRCSVLQAWVGPPSTPYAVVLDGASRLHPDWLPLACNVLDHNPELVGVFGEHLDEVDGALVWSLAPDDGLAEHGADLLAPSALVARSAAVTDVGPALGVEWVRTVARAGSLRGLPIPASRR